jgi:hypothetical protein
MNQASQSFCIESILLRPPFHVHDFPMFRWRCKSKTCPDMARVARAALPQQWRPVLSCNVQCGSRYPNSLSFWCFDVCGGTSKKARRVVVARCAAT